MIEDVQKFHLKFGLPLGDVDTLSHDMDVAGYRLNFLKEEVIEFHDAIQQGDRVAAFDALLDIVYVAQGTALFMGISPAQWNDGFAAVQAANMAKERVSTDNPGKRNSPFDVVKPPGWEAPEKRLAEILSCDNSANG